MKNSYILIFLVLLLISTGCASMQKQQIPIVIPTPQEIKIIGKAFIVEKLNTVKGSNPALTEALQEFSKKSNISINYRMDSLPQGSFLLIGSLKNQKIQEILKQQNLLTKGTSGVSSFI